MKVTKQATYSWDAVTNATEQETREFANYLLDLLGEKPVKPNLKFEIAPKSTESYLNWHDASLYCDSLNIDGKTGWRLPNKDELDEIYNSKNDFEECWYWSSTECSGDDAWGRNFNNGTQFEYYPKYHGGGCVRAIRDV